MVGASPTTILVIIFEWCGEASAVMRLLAPLAFVVLCGCATRVGEPFWVRTDGGPLNGKQFEADRAACMLEAQQGDGPIAAPGNAVRVCMAQRGYLQQLPQ
jgi:hypothetical protein